MSSLSSSVTLNKSGDDAPCAGASSAFSLRNRYARAGRPHIKVHYLTNTASRAARAIHIFEDPFNFMQNVRTLRAQRATELTAQRTPETADA
jgi:hypothetical protein